VRLGSEMRVGKCEVRSVNSHTQLLDSRLPPAIGFASGEGGRALLLSKTRFKVPITYPTSNFYFLKVPSTQNLLLIHLEYIRYNSKYDPDWPAHGSYRIGLDEHD